MSFIKSIVGWFKRKKDEPKRLSDMISNITPVSTPFMEAFNQRPSSFYTLNQMAPVSYQLKVIDRDIYETLKAIAVAEKSKKKRSHLKSKHRALKLQRLQIENKLSDYKNVW